MILIYFIAAKVVCVRKKLSNYFLNNISFFLYIKKWKTNLMKINSNAREKLEKKLNKYYNYIIAFTLLLGISSDFAKEIAHILLTNIKFSLLTGIAILIVLENLFYYRYTRYSNSKNPFKISIFSFFSPTINMYYNEEMT